MSYTVEGLMELVRTVEYRASDMTALAGTPGFYTARDARDEAYKALRAYAAALAPPAVNQLERAGILAAQAWHESDDDDAVESLTADFRLHEALCALKGLDPGGLPLAPSPAPEGKT